MGRPVKSKADRKKAVQQYAALVDDEAADASSFWQDALRGQIFLGDEDFVARMQAQAPGGQRQAVERRVGHDRQRRVRRLRARRDGSREGRLVAEAAGRL